MPTPKLVIASNGERTALLFDGVLIGPGVQRLDFTHRNAKSEIELLGVSVEHGRFDKNGTIERLLSVLDTEDRA